MGMPTQLEIVDVNATQEDYDLVFDYLKGVDERFSTYKITSEMSRINRDEIFEDYYSTEMQEVLALAEETSEITNGYFSIHTLKGTRDPSGLVKGWAINNAASLLWNHPKAFRNFYIEIAGDIQTAGMNAEGKEWSIGIRNPFVEGEIVKVVYPHGKGIATSGTYIRGQHIYNPVSREPFVPEFVSLTIIGPNVYEADRYATAVFVMGMKGLKFVEALEGFEAYAITHDGTAFMTSNFEVFTLPLPAEVLPQNLR